MPIPRRHEGWNETVHGLSGVVTGRIAGREVAIGAGGSAFIPRGIVHRFHNRSDEVAAFLSVPTPGLLGPGCFREMAELVGRSLRAS